MTKNTPAPKLTINERLDGLTGRDELAILDHFGHDVWDTYDEITEGTEDFVPKKMSGRLGRMLVFIEKVHDGLPPKVAFEAVLDMTAVDINGFLKLDETDDVNVAASGKGESTDDQ